MNSYEYLTYLRDYLSEQCRYNQTFTPYEIAAEILQRANQHDRYKLITTAHLTSLRSCNPNGTLPSIFEEQNLIDSIDANEQRLAQMPTELTINKFRDTRGGGNREDNKNSNNSKSPRRTFRFRRDVQCTCCSTYGHDVDEDVCKIGAQVFSVNNFITKHGEKATKNSKAYAIANNKHKIATARRHYGPDTDLDDIQDDLLNLAHSLTEEDE
jgi:hypothetical protein